MIVGIVVVVDVVVDVVDVEVVEMRVSCVVGVVTSGISIVVFVTTLPSITSFAI